jgi:hypothetical protein
MAISGTIVMEDQEIRFEIDTTDPKGQKAQVTITDLLTETQHSEALDARKFLNALAITLSWEGELPCSMETNKEWWADAESIQPPERMFRFIP